MHPLSRQGPPRLRRNPGDDAPCRGGRPRPCRRAAGGPGGHRPCGVCRRDALRLPPPPRKLQPPHAEPRAASLRARPARLLLRWWKRPTLCSSSSSSSSWEGTCECEQLLCLPSWTLESLTRVQRCMSSADASLCPPLPPPVYVIPAILVHRKRLLQPDCAPQLWR